MSQTKEEVLEEVEATLKRIAHHEGVVGTIILNKESIPVRSTFDASTTALYSKPVTHFTQMTRSAIRDLDPTNDLELVRIRSKKHELVITPDEKFILIVIQNPSSSK